jgi:hypothetical protein
VTPAAEVSGVGVTESVRSGCCEVEVESVKINVDVDVDVGRRSSVEAVRVALLATVKGWPQEDEDCWDERPMREKRVVLRRFDLRILGSGGCDIFDWCIGFREWLRCCRGGLFFAVLSFKRICLIEKS